MQTHQNILKDSIAKIHNGMNIALNIYLKSQLNLKNFLCVSFEPNGLGSFQYKKEIKVNKQ